MLNTHGPRGVLLATLLALALSAPASDARAEAARGLRPGAGPVPPEPGEDGQLSSKYKIDDTNPEASVPSSAEKNKNPLEFGYLIQDLLARGEAAHKEKNYAAEVKYYRAVAKAVPDAARSWSMLCAAYRLVNERAKAAQSCKYATEREGTQLKDFVLYVSLMLEKREPLAPDEEADLRGVVAHLQKDPGLNLAAADLGCRVGVHLRDPNILEGCTSALAKVAPMDPKTIIYQWNLAVQQGRSADAVTLLDQAKMVGVPADNLERMAKFTPGASQRTRVLLLALATLVLLAGVVSVLVLRRRRALAAQV